MVTRWQLFTAPGPTLASKSLNIVENLKVGCLTDTEYGCTVQGDGPWASRLDRSSPADAEAAAGDAAALGALQDSSIESGVSGMYLYLDI